MPSPSTLFKSPNIIAKLPTTSGTVSERHVYDSEQFNQCKYHVSMLKNGEDPTGYPQDQQGNPALDPAVAFDKTTTPPPTMTMTGRASWSSNALQNALDITIPPASKEVLPTVEKVEQGSDRSSSGSDLCNIVSKHARPRLTATSMLSSTASVSGEGTNDTCDGSSKDLTVTRNKKRGHKDAQPVTIGCPATICRRVVSDDVDNRVIDGSANNMKTTNMKSSAYILSLSSASAVAFQLSPDHQYKIRDNDNEFSLLICHHQQRLQAIMKESNKSLLLLQVYDHQQGLPKSHSPTLVKSSRSRKQLQEGTILSKWDGTPLINNPECELGRPKKRRRFMKTTKKTKPFKGLCK